MRRLPSALFAGELVIAVALAFSAMSVLAEDRPSILFIAVDDLRPMLGCYGDGRAITPNIDRLAGRGVLFERAYCTYSKCGPSRLSVMHGLMPASIGVYSNNEKDVQKFRERRHDAVPLSRWFRENGYETRLFGKIDHDGWSVAEDWSATPSPGREREMWEVHLEGEPETGIADRADCPVMQSPDVPDDHFFAGRMTEEVASLLRSRGGEGPFLYAVGFRRPHLPFVAPKKYFDLHHPDRSWLASAPLPPAGVPPFAWFSSDGYGGLSRTLGDPFPEKPDREEAIAANGFELRSYVGVPTSGELSEDLQLRLVQAYSACVSYVDAQIGKLLDALDETGLAERTVVVLWSDHGYHLGESSVWSKMTNYEVANRVPLLFAGPGIAAGRADGLASLVDLYPTLCALAGIDAPDHLEGVDLGPVLRDPALTVRDEIRHEYVRYNGRYRGEAVRTDQHRYIRWTNRKGNIETEELYDLTDDPHEQRNLAGTENEILRSMRDRLDRGFAP